MYKSRQKAIGVAGISLVILGAFAASTWAIVDASYRVPKGDALVAYYSGLTQYLNRGGTMDGSLNINSLSINDWINLNMPTRVLFKKTSNGFDGLYFTFDENNKNAPKTKAGLEELSKNVSKLGFIARVSFQIKNNSYSYSVYARDGLKNEEVELGKSTLTFTDSTFSQIKSISTKTPTSDFTNEFTNGKTNVGPYVISYSKGKKNESSLDHAYSFNVDTIQTNLKFFSTSIEPNSAKKDFTISNKSSNGAKTITSTYSEFIEQESQINDSSKETTTPKDYIIYNVSHQLNNQPLNTRSGYMSNWRAAGDNQYASFHLPNEIGLFPILTPFGPVKNF